ncbi:LOW QUALITY PROTEIN: uncharacterized protein LOC120258614 [Dioscorea cayenensis subsp. rotundata]|uniref:LOW QUALITY PROTEIN: uncharacterized protein LOC120258614 n=1 Tax=Dioscorea cayennensis subsp. rotundata TaxID=55577 RepID=A0AB40B405_DIOCR|nr:LOW QUALITY PROTEIN: uncharacterized protein LOC120258614 [Dioscorea cayenensis subsp. rotundata]
MVSIGKVRDNRNGGRDGGPEDEKAEVTYPNMMEFFEKLGVEMERSDMSFSVSLDEGKGCEWGSRNGLAGLFAQKRNALNPFFLKMISEILKFKEDTLNYLDKFENNPDMGRNETLEHFIKSHGYSQLFQKAYLVPICTASVWPCSSEVIMNFSAFLVLSFCQNHHLFQFFGRTQWLTVKSRSHSYVKKVREELENRSCQIRTGFEVKSITSTDASCYVNGANCSKERYDACVISVQAPDALKILGNQATYEETRTLGAFQYAYSDLYVHRDTSLMPKNPSAWSAWNFFGTSSKGACLTYWLNLLQNLGSTDLPFLVTLNPQFIPKHTKLKWETSHPIPSVAASKASLELDKIQGKRGIWFCGAYQGYGFQEHRLKAGIVTANSVLGKNYIPLRNPKHMVLSWAETGARPIVTKFLEKYIVIGSLTLLEEGGTIFVFEGEDKIRQIKSFSKVHDPLFYWKVATEADLGLADAYINGYFSFVDEQEGLLDFFTILIANMDLRNSSRKTINRGWWTPLLLIARVASARYFFRHVSRQNTIPQARQNISQHYDLSNAFFSLFLDETMTYSSAIFKSENEDLKVAQIRKISLLIEKARINSQHEILDIGCGWGSLAIEVVKQTGCKYTGITLSKEQLHYAQSRVKDAGLEDRITFLLCDYRQLPRSRKYNRIISCEMIEHIGHEYMGEFFSCCDSVLAEDGVFVLQFSSIPDERYDEHRRSSGFMKEYIFTGGCLPSLSRITSAMASSSRLCVEQLENIGIHYYRTLRCWRDNFMANKCKILSLGFDEKFIRTWEYYFSYRAAGFKTRTLGNYQVVFSRPGNNKVFSDPYEGFPAA